MFQYTYVMRTRQSERRVKSNVKEENWKVKFVASVTAYIW